MSQHAQEAMPAMQDKINTLEAELDAALDTFMTFWVGGYNPELCAETIKILMPGWEKRQTRKRNP